MAALDDDEKYTKDRLQWYQTMQKPLFDKRKEIEEIRRLAKLSLQPEKDGLDNFLGSTNGNLPLVDLMRSKTADFSTSAREAPTSSVVHSHAVDGGQKAKLLKAHKTQKTLREIREEDLAPTTYLKLMTDPVSVPPHAENYVRTTVLCFPGLGCSYSYFQSLAQTLHADNLATVYSVCLPQRMERVCEEADQYRLYEVIHAIRDEIVENQLVSLRPDRKLIFYGHSLGGLIAYEICRSLQRTHYHVSCLIVDSIRSPFRQTMFNFSEDPHGLDDHTIATHDTHGNLSRQNTMGAHLSMVPPPKPYYALNFQPIRDASLLPTISSHVSTPAGSVHNNPGPHSSRAPLSRGSSFHEKPAALSRGNSMAQKPSLSRGNSVANRPPLSRANSHQSPSHDHANHLHHPPHSPHRPHGDGGGLLGAALFNRSEQAGHTHNGVSTSPGPHHGHSHSHSHSHSHQGHGHVPPPLSRGHSTVSALSYRDGDEFDDLGNAMTTYEQVAADERELLPSILSELSDKQLQAAIYKLGGLPPLLQKRRDLLRKVVGVFRQDVRWLEEYFISAPVIPGFPYVEKVAVDMEDVHELLQMPPSMFKLHFPVFSIHADLDPWIQNEEVTAWTLTSNSYDHFIVEDANHFHVQHEGFVETLQSLISRIQAQQEDVDDGGTARQLHSGRVEDDDHDDDR